MQSFSEFKRQCQQRVEATLQRHLPASTAAPNNLHAAMRYSSLDGGKRVRPMLVYATGQAVGAELHLLDSAAAAIELIHVYSLIHDDLPAMDDDDLRRGRATCHKAFNEATAILAGDALQPLAVQILSEDQQLPTTCRLQMIQTLTRAAGSLGMAGGQALDLEAESTPQDLSALEDMHARKTGALILTSLQLGALSNPHIADAQVKALETFGKHIGLAFQIQDDILDEIGDTDKLGKPQGSDRERGKSTFVSLCGLQASQQRATDLLQLALDALDKFDENADPLRQLARYIVQRDN